MDGFPCFLPLAYIGPQLGLPLAMGGAFITWVLSALGIFLLPFKKW